MRPQYLQNLLRVERETAFDDGCTATAEACARALKLLSDLEEVLSTLAKDQRLMTVTALAISRFREGK